jgi:ATP-dependent helicase/nuclease subunit A
MSESTTRGPGLTEQQCRAIITRGVSVVLSSGAGCGKTEVLTRRYLSHLRDDGAEVSQLVAITFTDRAAREMRARIGNSIRADRAGATAAAHRDRWDRHLRNLETAAISTIHAFCGTLLRQHAVRAGLDPRFEVLEDVLTSNLRDDALRDALRDLLISETSAGNELRALVPFYGWRVTVSAIESLLDAPDISAWDKWSRRDANAVTEEWLGKSRSELLGEYIRYCTTAVPAVADGLSLLRSVHCNGPKMRANIARIFDTLPRLAEAPDLAAAVRDLCAAAKVQGTEGAKAWLDDHTYAAVRDSLSGLRTELKARLAPFTDEPDEADEAVAVGQRFVRVAAACARAYQARKRGAGVVDFHDLLTMARELLRDRADVREQVRQRFRFVLIDELQDTDPVQMELVELLCGAGLTLGKLFAVGDAKQSIYRFRGADVTMFQRLRRAMPPDGRQELSVNFRSQPKILHFANALFGKHIPDYEPLSANRPQANSGPCVEFLWTRRGEKESVQDGRRREADRIARRIAGMVARRERLAIDRVATEARPVRAGDVVLLFRSMSNVSTYEGALRRHGLDYYLVGGRAFFAQQEVYDLLNLLRALENPQDAVSVAGTLRSPFGCLSDETLYLLAKHEDGPWAGLHDDEILPQLPNNERPAAARARRFLDRWRADKDRLPIAGLLNLIFADCGYDAAAQYEFLGDRKLANLWKLIDLAREFDHSGLFGLAEFIARLGELVRSNPREEQAATVPESADVVRLMTIHQAKGSEFPVVILPDLAATAGGAHLPVAKWDSRLGCVARPPTEEGPPLFSSCGWRLWRAREEIADWHEDLRTLYVACTRAQDYLVLSAALPEPFKTTNTAMAVVAERFDLETGECRDGAVPPAERPLVRVTGPEVVFEDGSRSAAQRDAPLPLTAADLDRIAPIPVKPGASPIISLARSGPLQRMVNIVLRQWQFADRDGWQQPLADALADSARSAQVARLQEELIAGLEAFADSPMRRELAAAVELYRDTEFLLDPSVGQQLAMIQGRIDLLWRDAEGWQLLACAGGPATGSDRWLGRQPELLAAAWAVQRQVGEWPRSVGLYSFARRSVITLSPTEADAWAACRALADATDRHQDSSTCSPSF